MGFLIWHGGIGGVRGELHLLALSESMIEEWNRRSENYTVEILSSLASHLILYDVCL